MAPSTNKNVTKAEVVEDSAIVTVPQFAFTVKKAISLPIKQLVLEKASYITIEDKIFAGKQVETGAKKNDKPANLMTVTDLEVMQQAQIVVPIVLQGVLDEHFPNDGYVGLSFEIIKHAKKSGKDYHTFTVREIEITPVAQ